MDNPIPRRSFLEILSAAAPLASLALRTAGCRKGPPPEVVEQMYLGAPTTAVYGGGAIQPYRDGDLVVLRKTIKGVLPRWYDQRLNGALCSFNSKPFLDLPANHWQIQSMVGIPYGWVEYTGGCPIPNLRSVEWEFRMMIACTPEGPCRYHLPVPLNKDGKPLLRETTTARNKIYRTFEPVQIPVYPSIDFATLGKWEVLHSSADTDVSGCHDSTDG